MSAGRHTFARTRRPTLTKMRLRFQFGLAGLALVSVAGAQVFSSRQPERPSAATPLQAPASALPASAPPASGLTAATAVPAQRAARRADVTYAQGRLAVKADNSSLNLILREIGRQTGIKITGGVTEERVFGSYGPDTPDAVLAKLLDGAGSNVLLIASEGAAPGELVLTPRQGGPTPPNPNAKGFDDDTGEDDGPRMPVPRGVTLFGGAQPSAPQTEAPPQQRPNPFPPIGAPSPDGDSGATPGNPQSPNGVKTPQEIYQQLQQLRLQQQQQQQGEPPDGPA